MTLREIAVKSLLRRKTKAAFILAGLVIGIATTVAIISYADAMTGDINDKLEKYGANILIVPRTDHLSLTYGGMALGGVSFEMQEIREEDLAAIQTIANARNIAAVGPMVLGGVRVKGHHVLLAGVDLRVAPVLKPWWKIEGGRPGQGQVLLGAEAARVLGTTIGETLQLEQGSLTVSGVLRPTGSQDDHLLISPLATAQRLLGKQGQVSMVEVAALCSECPIKEMVQQITAALPAAKVMAIQQVVKSRMETLAQFKRFSYGISAVVVLIGGLVVLVTLMGSVRERTEEIGIFRAIGFRRKDVMRIVFIEVGIVSLLAGGIGYAAGIGAVKAGLLLLSSSAVVPVTPELAAAAVTMAVTVGLASSA
ncbi:MAG: ABC transporter permease, partial [Desulfobacteraceae bacterium]|nr:ABC transporter permease [Desulfobacteraceae bacterium]